MSDSMSDDNPFSIPCPRAATGEPPRRGRPARKDGDAKGVFLRLPAKLADDAQTWADLSGTTFTAIVTKLLKGYMADKQGELDRIREMVREREAKAAGSMPA